jgi:hypothetical protein
LPKSKLEREKNFVILLLFKDLEEEFGPALEKEEELSPVFVCSKDSSMHYYYYVALSPGLVFLGYLQLVFTATLLR